AARHRPSVVLLHLCIGVGLAERTQLEPAKTQVRRLVSVERSLEQAISERTPPLLQRCCLSLARAPRQEPQPAANHDQATGDHERQSLLRSRFERGKIRGGIAICIIWRSHEGSHDKLDFYQSMPSNR